MHTKFVIFVIIGSLLVATMYSSSTQFVFAGNPPKVTDKGAYPLGSDCTKNPDGTYSCTQDQDQDQDVTNPPKVTDKGAYPLGSDCTKNPDGTYSCTQDQDQDNKDDGLSDKPDSNDSNDNNDNSDR
jgi:hypothetical protein